ncbi:MAG: glycosyltransferase [Candidatus Nanopelagicales bacterium]
MSDPAKAPVVLVSFTASNKDPFTSQLATALSAEVGVRYFSWRTALLGRYDVLNLHWPDHLTQRRGLASTAARRALYAATLLRTRWGRPVLVRTLHNLTPHDARHGLEAALLRLTDRWTDLYITMQPDPPLTSDAPVRLVPQGHYRSMYAGADEPSTPGRVLFFGIIRSYKGVPELVEAFRTVRADLTLRIVGRVFEPELGAIVEDATQRDPRVTANLGWIDHDDLASEIRRSELVVLPYLQIFNSGTVVVALSLDRPVLVPDDPTTRGLAQEVGPGWVHTFTPPLTSDDIERVVDDLRSSPPSAPPDLSARDWDRIARAYAAAFEEAIDERRH